MVLSPEPEIDDVWNGFPFFLPHLPPLRVLGRFSSQFIRALTSDCRLQSQRPGLSLPRFPNILLLFVIQSTFFFGFHFHTLLTTRPNSWPSVRDPVIAGSAIATPHWARSSHQSGGYKLNCFVEINHLPRRCPLVSNKPSTEYILPVQHQEKESHSWEREYRRAGNQRRRKRKKAESSNTHRQLPSVGTAGFHIPTRDAHQIDQPIGPPTHDLVFQPAVLIGDTRGIDSLTTQPTAWTAQPERGGGPCIRLCRVVHAQATLAERDLKKNASLSDSILKIG